MESHHLTTPISLDLWQALQSRSRSSGQSVASIVQATLAEALDLDHDSVFQVSTSGAIFDGVFEGFVTIADLRRHGDFGLGTFDGIDGELIMLDGHAYWARSDGSVHEAPDDALTPFASVCWHRADARASWPEVASWQEALERLDGLRESENAAVGIRIDGLFTSLRLRAACRSSSGVDLATATRSQAEFEHESVRGTMVGFWSPSYASAISIPGYHMHFISDDRSSGGHVLDAQGSDLGVELNWTNDLRLAVPASGAFLEADLASHDAAAMAAVEHKSLDDRD